MEVQLQEIIDKIKREGIGEAEKSAATIKADAESKAAMILADARAEANRIIENAKREASRFEAAGSNAVSQAARDIILNLRASILRMLDEIVRRDVKAALSQDRVADILSALITAWTRESGAELAVLVPEKDIAAINEHFLARLKEEFRTGVTLKADPKLDAGFRIAERNGSVFYDFSDEGLASVMSSFVNPAVKECLDRGIGARSNG